MNYWRRKKVLMANNAAIVALVALHVVQEEEKKEEEEDERNRRQWVNPYLRARKAKGKFSKFEYIKRNPQVFYDTFHMSFSDFEELFALLKNRLIPKRNTRPDTVPLQAKLAIVLEFLASGNAQSDISNSYRISKQIMGTIIDTVCDAICNELADEIPAWDCNAMLECAEEFLDKWSFPNCVGAIGRKRVKTKLLHSPPNTIVLLGICDASYRFTYLDVEGYGSIDDLSAPFKNLEFPNDSIINGIRTPYFTVGDDGFPLCKRIMKPYKSKNITKEEQIFNLRLNRARHCIDNAFHLLSSKWTCMLSLQCNKERAQKILSTCCLLHNYLLRVSPDNYKAPAFNLASAKPEVIKNNSNRGRLQEYPIFIRNHLKNYVNADAGSMPVQSLNDDEDM